jgi:DNA repair protein RadC
MKDLLPHERPREKLLQRGSRCLTDVELIAVLLGSGSGEQDVMALSRTVAQRYDQLAASERLQGLLEIPGIGPSKAAALEAAVEFSRRRIAPTGYKVRSPEDILPLVGYIIDKKQEHLVCVSLNGAHEVIATRTVTIGLATMCQIHPREVLSDPILDRASSVILVHNHPSGELTPSAEDIAVTRRIQEAALLLGLNLLDHIIVTIRGHRSILNR